MPNSRPKTMYKKADWRVIQTGSLDGSSNEATDEAIHEMVGREQSPATLRFSGWKPGYLSLGKEQSWVVVNEAGCESNGWDIVRRITSGRAILQVDGLSVNVTMSAIDPRSSGDDFDRFNLVSSCFNAALKAMGLNPDRSRPVYGDRGPSGLACFDGPSEYQITAGGRKLVCGTVRSEGNAVSIQCTLPLFGDTGRISDALRFDYPGQRLALVARISYRSVTLESLLGRRMDLEEVIDYIRAGFAKVMNVELTSGDLSEAEATRAADLRTEKYSTEEWTKGSVRF